MIETNWYDGVLNTAVSEGTVLAQDWIRSITNANRPTVQSAPQSAATLPAAASQVESPYSKYVLWGSIGAAALGLIFIFMPKRKGSK